MKVTVYLGSNMGDNPSFKEATIALGRWIAKNGLILVYGGSKMGLMGVLGEGPTGIGDQVAIPHGKTAAVGKTAMAVGRLDKGIEWETLGEGTTRAFVMFAVNDKDTSELVSLLSQVAIALCDEKVIETLLNTESEAEIFTLFNRKGEQ